MKNDNLRLLILACALVLAAAWPLFAQVYSLSDVPSYRQALEFQNRARSAFNAGEYQQAAEYARQAETLSAQAKVDAERIRLSWVAYNLRARADEAIKTGEKRSWDQTWPAEFAAARGLYTTAAEAFQRDKFEDSIAASRQVLKLFELAEAEWMLGMKRPAVSPATVSAKPEFYLVRLIESARDCFWRIAGYDFIYGDPFKWPLLYEANRTLLQEPTNPRLIQPGMKFKIPSLAGEKRAGLWDDSKRK